MLARCARCNGTFSTDRYGRLVCPHCGAELILPAPPGTPQETEPAAAPGTPAPSPAPPAPPPPPAYGPPPGWAPPPGYGPPPPGVAGPAQPSPFADRARVGFLRGFFETWKLVATQPEQFFSRVRSDQPWHAVLFGVVASSVGSAVAALYTFLSGKQTLLAIQQMAQKMPEEQAKFFELYSQALTGPAVVAQVLLAPLFAFIGIYVAAAIVHLLLLLFRGAGRGFDATLTAVAYVTGLNLLLAVPACGSLIAAVWSVVALVIGLAAIQRIGTGKAAAAVLAPFLLVCLCICTAAGLAVPAFLKGATEAAKAVPTTHL
jgi:hypothetical protein